MQNQKNKLCVWLIGYKIKSDHILLLFILKEYHICEDNLVLDAINLLRAMFRSPTICMENIKIATKFVKSQCPWDQEKQKNLSNKNSLVKGPEYLSV